MYFLGKNYKTPKNELKVNPLYYLSFPSLSWQCGMKYTDKKLQTLQDTELVFLLENSFSGGF